MANARALSTDRRLVVYLLLGLLAGGAFVAFDVYSESRIGAGTISDEHAGLHLVIDHFLPLVVGPLLGLAAHYVRLRSRLSIAEEAASRTEALRIRLDKVERDQALWVLAAAVLHELNNPLHALRLLLDELSAEQDAARRRDLIARAEAQSDRLFSKLERLKAMRGLAEPHLERVDVGRLLSSIADDVRPLADERGVRIVLEADGSVMAVADRTYLRTIIENLVDNSLHALEPKGRGAIVLWTGTQDTAAVVTVSDDGPDLDALDRQQLFEPLRSTKQRGLGLGLPIARSLARAMGGQLALDESNGKVFRLELPLGDRA